MNCRYLTSRPQPVTLHVYVSLHVSLEQRSPKICFQLQPSWWLERNPLSCSQLLHLLFLRLSEHPQSSFHTKHGWSPLPMAALAVLHRHALRNQEVFQTPSLRPAFARLPRLAHFPEWNPILFRCSDFRKKRRKKKKTELGWFLQRWKVSFSVGHARSKLHVLSMKQAD